MLTFALLMSARMGIFQEILYKEYGKHSKEALFYNVSRLLSLCGGHTQSQTAPGGLKHQFEHSRPDVVPLSAALPTSAGLPAPLQWHLPPWRPLQPKQWDLQEIICFFSESLMISLMLFCSPAPVVVPVLGLSVPIMWLYLLGNTITQYPLKHCQDTVERRWVSAFISSARALLRLQIEVSNRVSSSLFSL